MIRKIAAWLVLSLCLLAFAVACGGDDDDGTASPTGAGAETGTALPDETSSPIDSGDLPSEAEVQAFFEQAAATLNGGDVAGFIALFSDKGLAEFTSDTETPTEELRQRAEEFLAGGPTITVTSVENIEPFQGNVGVIVNTTQGKVLVKEYFELFPYEGSYLIDAYQQESPDIPEGAESVVVASTEFKYDFVTGALSGDGNLAFTLNNDGEQPHEIILLKVSVGPALDELVEIAVNSDPSDLPAEIEEVIGSTFAPPAATSTMAFAEPLAPGRYAIMCFILDEADRVPHASKGMATEFAVE